MLSKKVSRQEHPQNNDTDLTPTYGARFFNEKIPRYALPEHEMLPRLAATLIHDELMLDGNARLNLATFVTTWMEPEARQLMMETFDKDMIDKDEYPHTAEIEQRCVTILARLWHAPEEQEAIGTSTIGSDEGSRIGAPARAHGAPLEVPTHHWGPDSGSPTSAGISA